MAALPNGNFAVTWESGGVSLAQVFSPDGAALAPPFALGAGVTSLTVLAGGDLLVSAVTADAVTLNRFELPDHTAITGTPQADSRTGTAAADSIFGLAGDDTLHGGGGGDQIKGGDGKDKLFGDGGDDVLDGGAGADLLNGGAGTDTASYHAAPGAVFANLQAKTGVADGSGETDSFVSIENLIGSLFDDRLFGDAGANRIQGGAGNDTIHGGAGDDRLFGGEGDDRFLAETGFDLFDGGNGVDAVNYALSGGINAFLDGSGTNGKAAFHDTFVSIENLVGSSAGADFLVGNGSANRFTGSGGADILWGRAGNDSLDGGAGADRLLGQAGNDVLIGGADADVFVFDLGPAAGGFDRTNDFVHGLDKIEIDASQFGGGLVAGGPVQLVSGAAPSSAGFATGVFLYNTSTGFLSYDADGQGAGAAVAFFRLQNLPGLSAADLTVVA